MLSTLRSLAAPDADAAHTGLAAGRAARAAVLAALLLGVAIRTYYVLGADFPLNDGGLFYLMTQELQRSGYRLPDYTAYNLTEIPYAYPPLGFYLAALLNDVLGVPLIATLRVVPLAATALTLAAVYALARDLLGRWAPAAVALVAYALVPRGYVWLLMGGGLTRSLGLLFAVLTVHQSFLLYTRRRWRHAALAALYGALMATSHLGTVPVTVVSVLVVFAFFGRHRTGVLGSLAVGAGVALLSAPWWGTVIARHGLAPFVAAQASGGGSLLAGGAPRNKAIQQVMGLGIGVTGEPYFPLIAVLGIIGILAALRPRLLVLPVWLMAILALELRAAGTYAVIPIAMLAGLGVVDVVLPQLRAAQAAWGARTASQAAAASAPGAGGWTPRARLAAAVPAVVLGGMLAYSSAAALLGRHLSGGASGALAALAPSEREAMAWVARSTPPASRFVVVTGAVWEMDRVGEWFPVLAARRSVNTVQGTEWLPGGTYTRLQQVNLGVQQCADAACLTRATADAGAYDYVYVPKVSVDRDNACCAPLIADLRRDPRFAVVYDGAGAFIVAPRDAGAAAPATPAARPSPG